MFCEVLDASLFRSPFTAEREVSFSVAFLSGVVGKTRPDEFVAVSTLLIPFEDDVPLLRYQTQLQRTDTQSRIGDADAYFCRREGVPFVVIFGVDGDFGYGRELR